MSTLIKFIALIAFFVIIWRLSYWQRTGGLLSQGRWKGLFLSKAAAREAEERRQRRWESVVGPAIKEVEDLQLKHHSGFHSTTYFGSMGFDPQCLAIWCFFKLDKDLREASFDGFTDKVQAVTRASLVRHGYPEALASKVNVSFGTDEEVQRDFDGNYWQFLK